MSTKLLSFANSMGLSPLVTTATVTLEVRAEAPGYDHVQALDILECELDAEYQRARELIRKRRALALKGGL